MFVGRVLAIGAVAVFVALLMVSPGGAVLPAPAHLHGPAGATATSFSPSATARPAGSTASRILSELHAAHVPSSDVFLPNLNAHAKIQNGTIAPTYSLAPAPMGIGDLGVQQVHGKNVGTVSYTSSVEATVTVNALNSTYLDGYGPDTVSIQLNTVLTNVDVFGSTSHQFWIQNVPVYVESTHKLYIVDNVWNFSDPTFDLTTNSLYSYHGTPVPPVFYFANGPTWTTAMPFTVRVYNNASVMNDRPTVFLNYSITFSNGHTASGSYDQVEFNSTGSVPPTRPAPRPTFQIDGQQLGAQGSLPNDAEIMLGGSSGGCTTSISAINATMTLATQPNGSAHFVPVPSAYNFGFDTGETAEGIGVWSTGGASPVAHLVSGPSILGPLWGIQGAVSGFIPITFHVQPSNAFAFASSGTTFHAGSAAWAPLLADGSGSYQLPPGNYSFEFLLSDHDSKFVHVAGGITTSVTLRADSSVGITTPLGAWGNGQLANISQPGGAGTLANPYVLLNGGTSTLNPLFGEFNDFLFPVFSGILLVNTSAYVTVTNAPSFFVTYSLPIEASAIAGMGLPTYNYLQQEYWNVHHVSVVANPAISGWYSSNEAGTMVGSVLFWNSSGNLIANNTFQDMSVGLFVYGGTGNVVSANRIVVAVPVCSNPSAVLNYPGNETGILLSASGDLLYNNYFAVPVPAVTPTTNVLTFVPSSYQDTWNVTSAPASHVRMVNGFSLSGNILGRAFEGGNFWSSYGTPADPYGVVPFNASGLINAGGDYLPLTPFILRHLTFHETGLTAGKLWSITVNGTTFSSHGTTIRFFEPAGTYAYVVNPVSGFTANPTLGAVVVTNGPASVSIVWT
jgi:parallel beta-helix repeat protein